MRKLRAEHSDEGHALKTNLNVRLQKSAKRWSGRRESNPRIQLGKRDAFEAHQGVRFKNSAFSALNDSIDYVAIVKLFSCLTDIFLRTRRRIRFTAEIWVLINQCLLRAKSGPKLATQYRCGDVTARKVLKGMDALIKKQFITA